MRPEPEIHVQPRMRPLRSAGEIVARSLRTLAAVADDVSVIAREQLITDEGEFAALATLRGRVGATPVEVTVGIVFGDDFYLQITAIARTSAAFAAQRACARALLQRSELGTPALRRRKYAYAPPPGWQPIERGEATAWYPADFPRHFGVLVTAPAQPVTWEASAALIDRLARQSPVETRGRTPARDAFQTSAGLAGEVVFFPADDGRITEVVLLSDGRFHYPMRLDTDVTHAKDHCALLEHVVDSVQPLRSTRVTPAIATLMGHWIDEDIC